MSIVVTKQEILEKSQAAFDSKGELDIIQLIDSLGIDVYGESREDDFDAHIEYSEQDGYFVTVNTNKPLTRQRFSLAHELAHFVLHKDQLKSLKKMNRGKKILLDHPSQKQEKEADELAAEILMPEAAVNHAIKEISGELKPRVSKSIIAELAEMFEVSRVPIAMRLRSLGYYVPYIEL